MIDALIIIAELAIIFSYVFIDVLKLRVAAGIGMIIYVIAGFTAGYDQPGMRAVIFFSGLAALVNFIQIGLILWNKLAIFIPAHLREIREKVFSSMENSEFMKICKLAEERHYAADEVLVEQNAPSMPLMIIINGKASVEINNQSVAIASMGDFIGEMSYITQEPVSATVRALPPEVHALAWTWPVLDKLKDKQLELFNKLFYAISINIINKLKRQNLQTKVTTLPSEKEDVTSLTQAKWRRVMKTIRNEFPSPWKESSRDQHFAEVFKTAITETNQLKHNRFFEEGAALKSYLGAAALPDYSQCKHVVLNPGMTSSSEVIHQAITYFNGLQNLNHPFTMSNVNPPGNIASIVCASLGKLFNPDIMEGEYSWNVAKIELETGAILSDLMGWDPQKSGGIYTYGGTLCFLYALKLALTTIFGKESRYNPVPREAQMLVSASAHYSKYTSADWVGLGIKNVREIPVNSENCMDIEKLKEEMEKCREEGKPIVMIACTIGTTDAFAIDSVAEVRKLIDSYTNAKGYGKPFLYADAVIGWSWMAFKNYDFKNNPLEFSSSSLKVIQGNFDQVSSLPQADAIGIDFHKTGWTPFNSSFFLVKDYNNMVDLLKRELPPYLRFATDYNPYIFTLETTRGASDALSGWASLKLFGYEGYQAMLGRLVEVTLFFRNLLEKEKNIVCVNPHNFGYVTLFRVYPKNIDAKKQYERELTDPQSRESLKAYNTLQNLIANKLFAMLRDTKEKIPGWENPPCISYTKGYRGPLYSPNETDSDYAIHALKAFPLSPFANELSLLLIRNYVLKARDLCIEELMHSTKHEDTQAQHWFGEVGHISKEYLVPESQKEEEKPREEPFIKGKDGLQFLRQIPLFFSISDDHLKALMECSEIKTFEDKTILFLENDIADKFYVILEGQVRIYKQETETTIHVHALLHQKDVFGEMSIFETGRRSASAQVLGSTTLLMVNGADFLNLCFN